MIADAEYLRKNNVFDAQSQLVVGQAYYKAGDYAGCVKYTKTLGGDDTALALQARCAYEIGDDATQRSALEQLVARTGKAEYWVGLLKLGERAHGLSDHNTLDINRLRLTDRRGADQGRLYLAWPSSPCSSALPPKPRP